MGIDDQRAGEVTYADGIEYRRSEIGPDGYESWAERAAPNGIYGEHHPPYANVRLD